MSKCNKVGDVISGFSFKDYSATKIRKDGDWSQANEVDVPASGEWLVVEAKMTGGGYAMVNDYFPDALHLTLQRLAPGRKVTTPRNVFFKKRGLRPQVPGRQIIVTQDTTCYSTVIPYVEPVGKFRKVTTWVEEK